MTPALEALICSELYHPNILATLRYACRPHKVSMLLLNHTLSCPLFSAPVSITIAQVGSESFQPLSVAQRVVAC